MERLLLREEFDGEDRPKVAGRTLTIRVATIGRVYRVGRSGRTILRERVLPGAFKEPLARKRGVLRFRHNGERVGDPDDLDNFYGVMTDMREDGPQVLADFDVFEGAREDKLLRLVDSGAVTGASMAAIVSQSRKVKDSVGPLTEIQRIREVNGVSITPTPGYDDAEVVAIRERSEPVDPEAVRKRLQAIEAERARWAATRARLLV